MVTKKASIVGHVILPQSQDKSPKKGDKKDKDAKDSFLAGMGMKAAWHHNGI